MEGTQGQFAEKDNESNETFFELRNYDPLLGRFNTIDPYGQYFSPYLAMGNSHPNMIDPDGGFGWPPGGGYSASNPFLGTAGTGGGGASVFQIFSTAYGIMGAGAIGSAFAYANALGNLNAQVASATGKNGTSGQNINLHDPNNYNEWNYSEQWKGNGDDHTFYVFGHGAPHGFRYYDKNGQMHERYTVEELDEVLTSKNSNLKRLLEAGEKVTIVFFACHLGVNTKAIGAELSAKSKYKNVTVIAPDGFCSVTRINSKTVILGVDNGSKTGGFQMYVNGKLRPGKLTMHYPKIEPKPRGATR